MSKALSRLALKITFLLQTSFLCLQLLVMVLSDYLPCVWKVRDVSLIYWSIVFFPLSSGKNIDRDFCYFWYESLHHFLPRYPCVQSVRVVLNSLCLLGSNFKILGLGETIPFASGDLKVFNRSFTFCASIFFLLLLIEALEN